MQNRRSEAPLGFVMLLHADARNTTAFLPHSPVPLGKQIVFGQAHFFLKGPSLDSEIRGNGQLATSQLSAGHADELVRLFSAEFVWFQHPVSYPSCASQYRSEEPSSAVFSLKVARAM